MQEIHRGLRLVIDNSSRVGIREKIVCRDAAIGRHRDLFEMLSPRQPLARLPQPNCFGCNAKRLCKGGAVLFGLGKKFSQGHAPMRQHSVVFVNNKRLRDECSLFALTVPVMSESDSIKREFAKRLASARHLAGFTSQKALADHLGMEAETYRRWERGETEPNLLMLVRLSDALNVSLETLIRGAAPRKSERRSA